MCNHFASSILYALRHWYDEHLYKLDVHMDWIESLELYAEILVIAMFLSLLLKVAMFFLHDPSHEERGRQSLHEGKQARECTGI
jgi:hypothetical protein